MTTWQYEWRAPTRADVTAWVELLAAVEAVERTGEILREHDVVDLLALSYVEPEQDARLAWADGEPIAYATVVCEPGGGAARVVLTGAVRPDWRGRGVGTTLLRWQIARGDEVATARAVAPDGWLEVSAGDSDTPRAELFTAEGFTPVRQFLQMRRDLSDPVRDAELPPGLELVPYDPARDDDVRRATNAAFRDHWGSTPMGVESWRTWVTGHPDFRPDVSFLVLDGSEIAGCALSSTHRHEWPALGFREGWTDWLAVGRPWRGRGVASALLAATLRALAADGLDTAALDVDAESSTGAVRLYERAGYRRERCRVAWARPASS